MFTDDTIAAISTPLGEGGIGIVRLSGKDSITIVEKIFLSPKNKSLKNSISHRLLYGRIKDPAKGDEIDEVLVTVMRSPLTYTKEDVVEINCHGGMAPVIKTLQLVIKEGARLAEPGEFTRRAFINGRIDLSQAEAVLDLIRAKTDESRKIAIEQLQGGLSEKITALRGRFHWYRDGIQLMPTFHPSYLLRNESKKKEVWEDMKVVLKALGLEIPEGKK